MYGFLKQITILLYIIFIYNKYKNCVKAKPQRRGRKTEGEMIR